MYRLLGIGVWVFFIQHSCPSGKSFPLILPASPTRPGEAATRSQGPALPTGQLSR